MSECYRIEVPVGAHSTSGGGVSGSAASPSAGLSDRSNHCWVGRESADNVGRDAVISHGKYGFGYMSMPAEVTGPTVVMDAFPLCALFASIPASSAFSL